MSKKEAIRWLKIVSIWMKNSLIMTSKEKEKTAEALFILIKNSEKNAKQN